MWTRPVPANVVQFSHDLEFVDHADIIPFYLQWQDLISDPKLDRRFATEFMIRPLSVVITGTFYGSQSEWENSGIPDRLPGNMKRDVTHRKFFESVAHDAENEALYLDKVQKPFYSKSLTFRANEILKDQKVEKLFKWVEDRHQDPMSWYIVFRVTGGAVGDISMNATSYPHRDKVMTYESYALGKSMYRWTKNFIQGFHNVLLEGSEPGKYGTYAGYADPALEADGPRHYWGPHLPALTDIKKKWDPKDRFHNPQSVRPPLTALQAFKKKLGLSDWQD